MAQDVQRSKEASLYGLALAYLRAEKIEKAKDIMDELIAKDRGNLFYLDAMTDIYISQGEPLKAVEMLRPHVTHNPRNQVLALNQANAYISANRYEEAVSLLKDFLLVKKDYQLAHQLMSEAYQVETFLANASEQSGSICIVWCL